MATFIELNKEQWPLYNLIMDSVGDFYKIEALIRYLEGETKLDEVIAGIKAGKYSFSFDDFCSAYLYLVVQKNAKRKDHKTPILVYLGLAEEYRELLGKTRITHYCQKVGKKPDSWAKYIDDWVKLMAISLYGKRQSIDSLNLRSDVISNLKEYLTKLYESIGVSVNSDVAESYANNAEAYSAASSISIADLIQLFAKSPSETTRQPLDREGRHYPSAKAVVDMIEGFCQTQEATEETDATLETHINQRQQIYENEIEFMDRYRVGDDCIGAVRRFLLAECYRFHDDERAKEEFDSAFYLARNVLNGFIEKNVFTEQMARYYVQVLNVFCSVYRDKAQTEDLDFVIKHFSLVIKAVGKASLQFANDGRNIKDVCALWDYYCETGKFVADLTERAFLSGIRMPVVSDDRLLPTGRMHYTIFYPYPFHDDPHFLPHDWFHLKFVSNPEMFRRSLSTVPSYYFKEYLRLTSRPELLDSYKMQVAEKETFKQFLSYALQNHIQIDGLISLPENYTDKESICSLIDEVIEGQDDYTAKSLLEEMKCYVLSENRLPFSPPGNEDE